MQKGRFLQVGIQALLCLSLVSCGGKFSRILSGNTTNVTFSSARGATGKFLQAAYQAQSGGVIVWGKSSTQQISFYLASDTPSTPKSLSLSNGSWIFYATGWSANSITDPMQGSVRCATTTASLTGTDTVVNLNLAEDCSTGMSGFYGPSDSLTSTTPMPLKVALVSCANLGGVTTSSTNCDTNIGDLQSYTVSLGVADPSIAGSTTTNPTLWTSACQNNGSGTSVMGSNLEIPVGDGGGPIYTVINAYTATGCPSSPSAQFIFPHGLAGAEASGNAQTVSNGSETFVFLAHAAPVIVDTYPTKILANSSASFLVTGNNFSTGTAPVVTLGGTSCSVTVLDAQDLICAIPGGIAAGTYTLIVTNPDGLNVSYPSFPVVAAGSPPVVSSIYPGAIPSSTGGSLIISGNSFVSGAVVNIGSSPCNSVTYSSSTQLSCIAPPLPQGNYAVTVENPDGFGAVSPQNLTVLNDAIPSISSISPVAVPESDTSITLGGANFVSGATVSVGGLNCPITYLYSTAIICTAPGGSLSPGSYPVVLTNADGLVASTSVTVSSDTPPTVTAVFPSTGPVYTGTPVTITGTGFSNGTFFQPTIGGQPCTSRTIVSSTEVQCITPSVFGASTYAVGVTNGDGLQSNPSVGFTMSTDATPSFTAATPTVLSTSSTNPTTTVNITGSNFVSGAQVIIGGSPCTGVNVVNASTITCTAPAGLSAGNVGLYVQNPDGEIATSGANYFTISSDPQPSVNNVFPSAGPASVATQIQVNGSGFASGGVLGVTVGGLPCNSLSFISSTQLQCYTAGSLSVGIYPVIVTNADGMQTTQTVNFTVSADAAPTISSFSPATISTTGTAPPTTITINGSNFTAGAQVSIGGGNYCNSPSVINGGNTITCTAPSGITPGSYGLDVINPDGEAVMASSNILVTSDTAPTLSSIFPTAGPVSTATQIEINGSGFVSGGVLAVTVGGLPCNTLSFNSSSQLQCYTSGSLTAGTYAVVVTNADGLQTTQSISFTVSTDTPPSLTMTTPYSIPQGSPQTLTLTGSNFTSGATVSLSSNSSSGNCQSVAISNGNTTITCSMSNNFAAGTYNVVVQNPDGEIAFGPHVFVDNSFGNGADGSPGSTINTSMTTSASINSRTFSANRNVNSLTTPAADGTQIVAFSAGWPAIVAADFQTSDEIVWHVSAASNNACETSGPVLPVGTFGFAHITNVDYSGNGAITIDNPITQYPNNSSSNGIGATSRAAGNTFCLLQVARVPNFQNLSISGGSSVDTAISPGAFSMSLGTGGLLAFRVAGTLSVTSAGTGNVYLTGDGTGYSGGQCTGSCNGARGDGMMGVGGGASDLGGPGAGTGFGAGGGGNAGSGGTGGSAGSTSATDPDGSCKPSSNCAVFGGGGGAGYNTSSTASGGNGGGIVLAYAQNIVASALPMLHVQSLGGATGGSDAGAPGGGAGGTVLLQSMSMTVSDLYMSTAGTAGATGSPYGGGGGGGGVTEARYCSAYAPTFDSGSPAAQGASGGGGTFPGASGATGNVFNTGLSSTTFFCP